MIKSKGPLKDFTHDTATYDSLVTIRTKGFTGRRCPSTALFENTKLKKRKEEKRLYSTRTVDILCTLAWAVRSVQ